MDHMKSGWRLEQKYANKVLVGNWVEERLQVGIFKRVMPSVSQSSEAQRSRLLCIVFQGLPSKLLHAHYGPPRSHYFVTQYDDSYGRRHSSALPTLHPSDHPVPAEPPSSLCSLPAPPTNFGPLESKKHCLERQQSHLPPVSVYRSSYQRHPLSAFCQRRFASASRMLSSHLHAANHNNKDLDLRQRSLLQVPDHGSSLLPPSQGHVTHGNLPLCCL
uniref:Si:ch211-226m7.4 n=1 Tax=Myripristis murdjan TaxID=586833 RepID=A0A667ZUK2_9TELE